MGKEIEEYGIENIESLSFKDGVRRRVNMYLGSDDIEGAYQSFKEIINNSTDEILAGFGKKIEIDFNETANTLSIRDYGRGVPFGIREGTGENVLVSIYTKSHTGGKFDNKAYANSSGLNGIGGSCVCLSSSSFQVTSYRDGKGACAKFEKGNLINYEEFDTTCKNGTLITFSPDKEVFKNGDIQYSYDRLCTEIKNISYLYKGIAFDVNKVNDQGKRIGGMTFKAENGIADLIKDNKGDAKSIHNTVITGFASDGTNDVEIAFQWTNGHERSFTFTNGLLNPEGGTPLTGAKTSITRTVNNLINESLTGDLARTGLVYAMNCKVSNPSFANQTKTKVNNVELRGLADKAFSEAIKEFAKTNQKEFQKVEEFLTKELKAEKAADKARAAAREQNDEIEKETRKKAVLAGKLTDCRRHDSTSELWLCEGDSAGGAIAKARDGDIIAVFPCRGKGLNVLKEKDIERILKNEEYRQIMVALGCGYGDKFNINKLRYGKIVIASDADVDGHSIACLLLTFFYRFYPRLLREGYIYRAELPLYGVTVGNKKYYAYSDEELAKLPKGEIERNKG